MISNDKNRVRWVVLGLSQDGPAPICLKISVWIAKRETYRMLPLSTHLFSHWSIPLRGGDLAWKVAVMTRWKQLIGRIHVEIIEWFIEVQAILRLYTGRMIRLLALPLPPSRQQLSLFLSLPLCRRRRSIFLLTVEGGGGEGVSQGAKSWRRASLALYKSFNTL